MLSTTERSIRGRIAAYCLHSRGLTSTAPARKKSNQKFLDEVDPKRVLPKDERLRRAAFARKAYYARMALRSVQARRQRSQGAVS